MLDNMKHEKHIVLVYVSHDNFRGCKKEAECLNLYICRSSPAVSISFQHGSQKKVPFLPQGFSKVQIAKVVVMMS